MRSIILPIKVSFCILISLSADIINTMQYITEFFKKPKENKEQTAWFKAARDGDLDTIKLLIKIIDIDAQDDEGVTALMHASYLGHIELVTFLLNTGQTQLNLRNNQGRTALIFAVCFGKSEIFKLLLDTPGIELNIQDNDGWTALVHAAYRGRIIESEILLKDQRVDINIATHEGWNALMYSIAQEHDAIAQRLLAAPGIVLCAKNKLGWTALAVANEKKRHNIALTIERQILDLRTTAFQLIKNRDIERFKAVINQIGVDFGDLSRRSSDNEETDLLKAKAKTDGEKNTLLHASCAYNCWPITHAVLLLSENPQELMLAINNAGQWPFELVEPNSDIFKLFVDCAYGYSSKKLSKKDSKTCAHCKAPNCISLCGKCKSIYYCSVSCQQKHWQTHKRECKINCAKS